MNTDNLSLLLKAKEAYYNETPIMSDMEYDKLEEKVKSEGAEIPVGAPVSSNALQKVKHKFQAKSLDKTKDIDKVIKTFTVRGVDKDNVVVMWKLDGSTVQLTYYNGKLFNAATRGDGIVGQNITNNAKYIEGIPQEIEDKGLVTVRGEAVMSYKDFDILNMYLSDEDKYKNPRNLANASITMKNPDDMKDRCIKFRAFELVFHENMSSMSFYSRLKWCEDNKFGVVTNELCNISNLRKTIDKWSKNASLSVYPVDGLVIAYNDTSFTDSLQGTEHHPNVLKGFALKWKDDESETVLRNIIWQPSRTGLLNPVAEFDPVTLEGTTVSRASLHNFSIMRNLHIRIGDKISVYKANKIIPQIASNLSDNTDNYTSDDVNKMVGVCPVCGCKGVIHTSDNGIESVYCENSECTAKKIDSIVHFCSRGCMDIEGLSEATIEKFMSIGIIKNFSDIYELDKHKDKILEIEGFGEKSYNNLIASIERSRKTSFVKFVTAIGIPGIGSGQAKLLSKEFNDDIYLMLNRDNDKYEFDKIQGFGEVLSNNLRNWIHNNITNANILEPKSMEIPVLMSKLEFVKETTKTQGVLNGKVFVVTGKVEKFENRDAIHKYIEDNGGKTTGSVTGKTSYLVNNDITSTSGKNKKAKELNVPIISEYELIKMVEGND